MTVEIIQATNEHLALAASLFTAYRVSYGQPVDLAAAEAFLALRLKNCDSTIFLAVDDSRDSHSPAGVAFAQLYPSFSSVAMKPIYILNDLFVASEHRRGGWGRKMLHSVADFARQNGAARIVLATAKDNLPAQKLYESSGYRLDEIFQHYSFSLD